MQEKEEDLLRTMTVLGRMRTLVEDIAVMVRTGAHVPIDLLTHLESGIRTLRDRVLKAAGP